MKFSLCLGFSLLASSPCLAQSGADALLEQLGEKPAQAPTGQLAPQLQQLIRGDLFQQQLGIMVLNHRKLGFDVRQWAQMIVDNEYAKAAHLWTSIQPGIPEDFRDQAEAAQLYLLWKLGLAQTFFDQWVKNLANSEYAQSTPELTLETIVTPNLDAWLLREGVTVSPRAQTILDRLTDKKPFTPTLKALASFRRAQQAEEILPQLPPENKMARFVASTVVYNHVKNGDLKGAAKILKANFEPAIEATHDPELLAKHDLSIGRILYQAGQMKAAAVFYQKIPNQSPSYMPAREELAWVYLRTGDTAHLRGELKGLASPVFKDRFQPETYLLRAISDLKMCYYEQLDKDLTEFSASNEIWAKKIDQALSAPSAPKPASLDEYSRMAEINVTKLESELKRLVDLGEKSVGATLPAVGWQQHWKDYQESMQSLLGEARKRVNDEYARQWKNQRLALQEAIRKMRFVKVEYMSQVRQLAEAGELDARKVASASDSLPASAVAKPENGQLSFPATTEVWSDELFKLRSAAQARCLKKAGTK